MFPVLPVTGKARLIFCFQCEEVVKSQILAATRPSSNLTDRIWSEKSH